MASEFQILARFSGSCCIARGDGFQIALPSSDALSRRLDLLKACVASQAGNRFVRNNVDGQRPCDQTINCQDG